LELLLAMNRIILKNIYYIQNIIDFLANEEYGSLVFLMTNPILLLYMAYIKEVGFYLNPHGEHS